MTSLRYTLNVLNASVLTVALFVLCSCATLPHYADADMQSEQFFDDAAPKAKDYSNSGQNALNQDWIGNDGKIIYLYLVLNSALFHGDADTAVNSIQELLYLAPTEELFREAVSIYDFSGNHDMALSTVTTGTKLYPMDLTLNMMLAELLTKSGKVDEAITKLTAFSAEYNKHQTGLSAKQKRKDLSELRLLLIRLLMSDKRYKEAETAIAASPPHEQSATVLFYAAQICKATGRSNEALQKLDALVKQHPNFTEGWMAIAAEAEQVKNYYDASIYYKKALKTNEMPQIYFLLLNSQILAGQYKTSARQVINSAYAPDIKLQAAKIFIERNHNKEAREILLSIENDSYITDDINFYLAMLANDDGKDYDEALKRIERISPDVHNRAMVLHLKAILLVKTKNYAKAIETGEVLVDEFPDIKNNWLLLSELHNTAKNYDAAINIAKEALEQWTDDYQLLYALGASLGFQKKTEEAVLIMDKILDKNPNDAMALNFAGYMLADNNTELEHAKNMIDKALALEPKNYQIMDSMAWVQYRLKEYKNAWETIRQCIKLGANDPVIWEHYGDIAAAMDKKDEAIRGYEKALLTDHEDADGVHEKINLLKGN